MKSARCKFRCTSVSSSHSQVDVGGGEYPVLEVKLEAQYDPAFCEEDNAFSKFTPSGEMAITINNPALVDHFKAGRHYYIDVTPVDAEQG